ncbi:MAG: hypothetical protein RL375_3232 [Pseudomonadota bacterium]
MHNDQNNRDEWTQLGAWIADMPVAMMTNLDADGTLTSRPMWLLGAPDAGALWFLADARSTKMQRLEAINLSFSDAARSRYVSLSGRAEIDTDRARLERLWTPQAATWFPGGRDDTDLVLLKFIPTAADHWDTPRVAIVDVQSLEASLPA